MKYGNVTGVDKQISRLVQGTVYFTPDGADEAFALFDTAFEMGCNTFDTAHSYQKGQSELVLGQWIQSRGVADKVVILSKGCHPHGDVVRVTPEILAQDLHESLERLQVDTIDMYILHRDDESKPVELFIDEFNKHYDAGLIKAFGGSNWRYERIQEANEYAKANGLQPFAISSPQYSLAEMVEPAWDGCLGIGGESGKPARKWYQENDVALFTWSSLAGGFMTGRFTRENLDSLNEYFETTTKHAYCYEDNFKRLDRAKELAEKKGVTLPSLALAFILNQSLNLFAVVGSKTPEEFKMNVADFEIELSPAELAWLDLETEEIPL